MSPPGAQLRAWLTVKNAAAVVDMLVKVAALAAALLAANIFLFRAEVAHSVQVGNGVSRDYVTAEYGKLSRPVPDVLLAVMADLEDDAVPMEWAYPSRCRPRCQGRYGVRLLSRSRTCDRR